MQPANDQRSLLFLGFGILTAAAVIFLIVRGLGASDKKEESRGFVADVDSKSGQATDKASPSDLSTAGASRPAPEVPLAPVRSVAELLSASKEAIKAKNFTEGLALCSSALQQEPGNENAHVNCAVAACSIGDAPSSRFHLAEISDGDRLDGVKSMCQTLGVALDGPRPMLAGDLHREARKKMEQEDYQAAQSLCLKSLMLEPGFDGARGLCTEIACHLGQAERAQNHLDKISSKPRRDMASNKCATLNVTLDDSRSASPTNSVGKGRLSSVRVVQAAFENKDYAASLRKAEDALKLSPYDTELLAMASLSACALRKDDAANKHQERLRNSEMRNALEGICRDLDKGSSSKDAKNRHYRYLVKNGVIAQNTALVADLRTQRLASQPGEPSERSDAPKVNKPLPPPVLEAGAPTTAELMEQAEMAVRETQFGKGGKLCRQVLDREPGNQRAATACAIAACNLKKKSTAKKYIRRIKSSQRRQGLKQICTRLGNRGFGDDDKLEYEGDDEDEEEEEKEEEGPSIDELLKSAEKAVRSTQFGRASRECRQVLKRKPGNQRAITVCAIADCNLRNASSAKKFIRRIKSSQRRAGLNQICHRLGNDGFDD
jgi:thioredoxin-like negative regulator of GroEL